MANDEKMMEMAELSRKIKRLKAEGKKIIYAHGAFDMLHAGHMHHLKEAKKLGDTLVVTITKDKFIKKGPGRPRFNENERAKFVGMLSCVDLISFTDTPDAVDAIKEISPHVYVKGEDVKDKSDDPREGLYYEIKALKEMGGEMRFIKSLPIHSTDLLNQFFNVYDNETSQFLLEFSKRYSLDIIFETIKKAKKLKVLVIGDAIVDSYCFVEPMGKSPKGDNISVKIIAREDFAGGVMACANHIAGFCDSVSVVTCLGTKNPREKFIKDNLRNNITPHFFYRDDAPTTLKRRFIESAYLTKFFEVYSFNDENIPKDVADEIAGWLKSEIKKYDVVLSADYGHGFLTEELIDLLSSTAKFLAISVQTNSANHGFNLVTKYPKADYVCIDEPEIRLATHSKTKKLQPLIKEISEATKADKISITRGHRGCVSFSESGSFYEIPVLSTKIVDTVGAGDAFFSVSSAMAALNAPMELVGFMGNVAGAMNVSTLCNKVPIDLDEFKNFIKHILF